MIVHINKVLLCTFQYHIKQMIEAELTPQHADFRKGWGTRDQIVNIHLSTEKCREYNHPLIMYFTDYSKSFDIIQNDHLWSIVTDMGIPKHLIKLITSLLSTINHGANSSKQQQMIFHWAGFETRVHSVPSSFQDVHRIYYETRHGRFW